MSFASFNQVPSPATLAKLSGASKIGTSSGNTVEQELLLKARKLQQVASFYNNGVEATVREIASGLTIDSYDVLYYEDSDGITIWDRDGQTGTLDGTFNKNTGVAGLTPSGSVTLRRLDFDTLQATFPKMADQDGRRFEIWATVIRQDSITGLWDFIIDPDHFHSVYPGASVETATVGNNTVRILLGNNYNRIVSASVVGDETFAEMGVTCGVSLDNAEMTIKFSKNKLTKADIFYNGTSWTIANETALNQSQEVTGVTFTNGRLEIDHRVFWGSNVVVTPLGTGVVPYQCMYAGGNGTDKTYVKFVNEFGNYVGAEDTQMRCRVQWFDGEVRTANLDDKLYDGNVWIMLLMEK